MPNLRRDIKLSAALLVGGVVFQLLVGVFVVGILVTGLRREEHHAARAPSA